MADRADVWSAFSCLQYPTIAENPDGRTDHCRRLRQPPCRFVAFQAADAGGGRAADRDRRAPGDACGRDPRRRGHRAQGGSGRGVSCRSFAARRDRERAGPPVRLVNAQRPFGHGRRNAVRGQLSADDGRPHVRGRHPGPPAGRAQPDARCNAGDRPPRRQSVGRSRRCNLGEDGR